MLYSFQVYKKMIQLYMHFFFRFFSIIGYYKLLSIVPWATAVGPSLSILCSIPKWGFPYGSAGKESACSVGDLGSIPGLGRSSGEGKGYPLQYSGLENSMVLYPEI